MYVLGIIHMNSPAMFFLQKENACTLLLYTAIYMLTTIAIQRTNELMNRITAAAQIQYKDINASNTN